MASFELPHRGCDCDACNEVRERRREYDQRQRSSLADGTVAAAAHDDLINDLLELLHGHRRSRARYRRVA